MNGGDALAAVFEARGGRLHSIAYRMLGSHAEADDAVQDAWLRLTSADTDSVDNVDGWLTTVVSRICLDRLRTRAARREDPADRDLGENSGTGGSDPEHEAVMGDSVGAALLVVLDMLAPAERVAFVLHDVFAVPFEGVAEVLDRTPAAARQLASRARRRVQGAPAGAGVDLVRQRTVVAAFLQAAREGDIAGLLRVLHPDVVLRPDSAALRMGSLRETRGAGSVAAALGGGGARGARLATLDGLPGFAWAPGDEVRGAVRFTVVDDRIVAIDVTGDAERIAKMEIVLLED